MKSKIGYNYFFSLLFPHEAEQDETKASQKLPGFSLEIICLTLAYIAMTIASIIVFGRVKKFQYLEDINRGSSSKKIGDKILLWHFIFL